MESASNHVQEHTNDEKLSMSLTNDYECQLFMHGLTQD